MKYRNVLKNLSPYKPGKSNEEIKKMYGLEEIVKLSSNENPYGESEKVIEEIKKIKSTEIYPDNYCTELRNLLSSKLQVPEEKFIFGNGSVEIIQMISRVFLDKDDEAITCVPSFQSYFSETTLQDAKLIEIPLKNNTFDLNGILEKINEKTKLIYITNPNNPTGTIITSEKQREFLKKVPKDILVVLDEAYAEFVTDKKYPKSEKLLEEYDNICILRTFSKAYGLAGLRVGYGMASKEVVEELEKARVPFNIATIAQKAAIVALQDDEFVNYCREKNKEVLEYLYQELDKMKINYIKSEANFIMIDAGMDGNVAFEKLLKQGFIVRPGFPNMENYIRVSIGTLDQMKKFIVALKNIKSI